MHLLKFTLLASVVCAVAGQDYVQPANSRVQARGYGDLNTDCIFSLTGTSVQVNIVSNFDPLSTGIPNTAVIFSLLWVNVRTNLRLTNMELFFRSTWMNMDPGYFVTPNLGSVRAKLKLRLACVFRPPDGYVQPLVSNIHRLYGFFNWRTSVQGYVRHIPLPISRFTDTVIIFRLRVGFVRADRTWFQAYTQYLELNQWHLCASDAPCSPINNGNALRQVLSWSSGFRPHRPPAACLGRFNRVNTQTGGSLPNERKALDSPIRMDSFGGSFPEPSPDSFDPCEASAVAGTRVKI
ncbi:hypothetical protein B0H17DRAFT_1140476 [Mycena rosella]|uniref:Uncharacterized protein n=1 Tax=Mycena rosella TaxID=1033263 RepID=A0AAD7D2H0_MYCRO|nr:hypothetical protein B0H17DRAFT_1140476 [Mycena rosella]